MTQRARVEGAGRKMMETLLKRAALIDGDKYLDEEHMSMLLRDDGRG